jgi:tRNA A-37 threonylcarbamoyl transferase component Bud32
VRWELAEEIPLDDLLANTGKPVKESPVKLVTVHNIAGKTYYVKRYRHAGVPLRPLKFFFKPSQAHEEWAIAQQLQSLGVPIVRHVALGERRNLGGLQESILITEGFDGHAPTPSDAARVLAFVRMMHERGVLQRDLHPGNILVGTVSQELRLVDVHGTVVKPQLSESERQANLAFLRVFLPLPVNSEVLRLSNEQRKHYYHYYSKRCLKVNREFSRRRLGRLCWHVRLPFLDDRLGALLRDPDRFLSDQAEILKPGLSSTVGRADGLILKRYNLRKVESIIKDLFRASRARRAFHKAYHLELLGIPTAKPIAAAERRVLRVLLRSYFVMEEIPHATEFGQWRGDGEAVLRRVAELLAKLHNEGFSHRDLKETNIVLDARGQPYLLDLEGLCFVGELSFARAAADLARFAKALGGQWTKVGEKFLTHYCAHRGLEARQRELASQITSYLGGRS